MKVPAEPAICAVAANRAVSTKNSVYVLTTLVQPAMTAKMTVIATLIWDCVFPTAKALVAMLMRIVRHWW